MMTIMFSAFVISTDNLTNIPMLNTPEIIGEVKSGSATYHLVCIDGIVYLLRHAAFTSYFTAKINPDAFSLEKCENKP